MNLSWDKPPSVVAITGDEHFLRRRWLHHTTTEAFQAGYEVIHAGSDGEVVDALSMGATFGQPTLIRVDAESLDVETVEAHLAEKPPKVCLLVEVPGTVSEKKHPSVALVKKKHRLSYNVPSRKQDQEGLARKFLFVEATRLLGSEESLSPQLAKALINALGTDLGVLSYEMSKITALVRFRGGKQIEVGDVTSLIRGKTGAEMQPLRDALAQADGKRVAKALIKIRRKSASDPTMLLLRARGGPADLAYQWLQAALLLKRGCSPAEVASGLGSPGWIVEGTTIPAAKKWGVGNLILLVRDLAHADRGLLKGAPAPWVACEAALLRGCSSVGAR
jgi:DNA polymerase III delta subunit